MKKFLVLLCVISLLLTSTAFAMDDNVPPLENMQEGDKCAFVNKGHGEYEKVSSTLLSNSGHLQEDSIVYADYTGDLGFYHLSENYYLVETKAGTYLENKMYDIDIYDFSANDALFSQYGVSTHLIQDMEKVIASQEKLGNSNFSVELYVPTANASSTKTDSYFSHTYGGKSYRIHDINVKYKGLCPRLFDVTGTKTLSVSKSAANLAIAIGGIVKESISFLGVGTSIYDLYKSIHGPVTVGSSSDQLWVTLTYDRILKDTYVFDPSAGLWMDGMTTHKVWLDYVHYDIYFRAKQRHYTPDFSLNHVLYSTNFNNYNFAIQMSGPGYYDTPLSVKLYNTTIVLLGT